MCANCFFIMKKIFSLFLLFVSVFSLRLSAQEPNQAPSAEQYNLKILRWARTYYDYSQVMHLQLECENGYYFNFDINVTEDAIEYNHTYTLADLNPKNSYGYRGTTNILYQSVELIFFLDELEREVFNLSVVDKNNNSYTLNYRYKPLPEMVDTINVVIKDADFVDERDVNFHNYFYFQGKVDSLEFFFYVMSPQLEGEIAEKDVYIGTYSAFTFGTVYNPDGTYKRNIEVGRGVNGKVEKGKQEGDYICTVDLLCYDAHCYHVTFRHEKPAAAKEVDLHFTNMTFNEEFFLKFGVYSYVGSLDDYRTEIILYSAATPNKTYVVPSEVGTVWLYDSKKGQEIPVFTYSDVTVTGTKDSPILKADYLAKDSTLYHITLEYTKPSASREETLTVQGRFADMIAESGTYQALAYNADSSRIVSLMIKTQGYAGHFVTEDLDTKYTYVLQDYVASQMGGTGIAYKLVEADITAVYTELTKTLSITGTLLCENGTKPSDIPLFTLNMTCTLDEGLDYDCDNQDANVLFTSEQMKIETQYDPMMKIHSFMVSAENDLNQMAALLFFAKGQFVTGLPAGTYPVNSSFDAPSLLSSTGVDDETGSVSLSFLATMTENGGLTSPIWFLRGGSAKVEYIDNQVYIEVNATNSYGRVVHIEMGAGVVRDLSQLKANDWTKTATAQSTTLCSMTAKDGSYIMQVEVNAPALEDGKVYETADMILANCFAVETKTQDTIFFSEATFVWHVNQAQEETATISATDAEGVAYGITCQKVVPVREETIEVHNAILSNYIQEYGLFEMRGNNDAGDRLVSVAVYTNQIMGHFTQKNMDPQFTYVIDNPDEGDVAVMHELVTADVEVYITETDTILHMVGYLVCRNINDSSDVCTYHIHQSCKVTLVNGLPYDAEYDNPYSNTFDAANIKWNTEYFESQGTVFMEVGQTKGDVEDFVYLGFVVNELDDQTGVPQGVYPFSFQGAAGTAMSSTGVSPTGQQVAASFVAKRDTKSGLINPPLWFMQYGTVVVGKDDNNQPNITIQATNSKGADINIEIKSMGTNLPYIRHQAPDTQHKVLHNGQIYILDNNRKFNISGLQQ